jgi:hypothetical protein
LHSVFRSWSLIGFESANLYTFVNNHGENAVDYLGLALSDPNNMAECLNLAASMMALAAAIRHTTGEQKEQLENMWNQAKNAYDRFCGQPPFSPEPEPEPKPCPRWIPPQNYKWNFDWPRPTRQQQQCTVLTGGTIIIVFCIPWPGNPVYLGL